MIDFKSPSVKCSVPRRVLKKSVGCIRLIEKTDKPTKQPSFLYRWRSFSCVRLVQYIFMYASVLMLAYGIHSYDFHILKIILFSIVALYSGFFATLLWNDITDIDIDVIVHPDRPLPAGRISVRQMFAVALVFSSLTFIFSFLVSFWCFLLVGLAALFVTIHNKHLKKIVRFPAYSEIFSPIQWVIVPLFGFLASWTTGQPTGEFYHTAPFIGYISFDWYDFQNMIFLVLFTYLADNAHDLPEGIHDVEGDKKLGVKTYATSFGVQASAKISFCMILVSGLFGIILFLRTILTPIFLVPFLFLWSYAVYHSILFIRFDENKMKLLGKNLGEKLFRYYWITFDLIFLDVFIQILRFNMQ